MKKYRKLIIAMVAVIGAGVLIAGLFFSLTLYSESRIPNKTYVAGINLSFEKHDEAVGLVKKKANEFLDSEIRMTAENRTLRLTPRELGVKILPEKTIQTIIKHNTEEKGLVEFFFPKEPPAIDPIVFIDTEELSKKLEERLKISQIEPVRANFYLENKKLEKTDGKMGFRVDFEKLIQRLKADAKKLKPSDIKLEFKFVGPDVTAEDLELHRESTSAALLHTFTLVDPIYSDNWDERLIDHPEWVSFVPTPERINIKINKESLNRYVDEELSKWLDVPADKVNIYMDDEGKIIIEGQGHDGSSIKRGALKDKIEVAVANRIKNIPIPIEKMPPKIKISKKLQDMGIKERISVGHTSFYGSPANRVHNIKVGAEKFNGKLIAPDEVLSFNSTLGQVDASTGYKKELVIKPEGTIPEYGGGICQVSTTMYRAVLFSGLPVVERNQHSYAVGYYSQILGHGLDATIYLGGADMKFKNDTGGHILVQAYTKDEYELYYIFYGTDPKRTVEMDGPYLSNYRQPGPAVYIETMDLPKGQTKQLEKKHTGFDAVWYRYITDETGAIEVETISTRYKAVPDKIQVGTREN